MPRKISALVQVQTRLSAAKESLDRLSLDSPRHLNNWSLYLGYLDGYMELLDALLARDPKDIGFLNTLSEKIHQGAIQLREVHNTMKASVEGQEKGKELGAAVESAIELLYTWVDSSDFGKSRDSESGSDEEDKPIRTTARRVSFSEPEAKGKGKSRSSQPERPASTSGDEAPPVRRRSTRRPSASTDAAERNADIANVTSDADEERKDEASGSKRKPKAKSSPKSSKAVAKASSKPTSKTALKKQSD